MTGSRVAPAGRSDNEAMAKQHYLVTGDGNNRWTVQNGQRSWQVHYDNSWRHHQTAQLWTVEPWVSDDERGEIVSAVLLAGRPRLGVAKAVDA